MPYRVRKSKQRDRILELLRSDRIHVTANWIYDSLRQEFPTLSLGNVYRNLNILVDQGNAVRLGFGSTFDLYEAKREPHFHFICTRCGDIQDVTVPERLQTDLLSHVESNSGHTVTEQTVEFRGICSACRHALTNQGPDPQ